MIYNKNQIQKSNSKKILHKIGKMWVVIAITAFSFLGFKMENNVLADNNPSDFFPKTGQPINNPGSTNYFGPDQNQGPDTSNNFPQLPFLHKYSVYNQRKGLPFSNGDTNENRSPLNHYNFALSANGNGSFNTNLDGTSRNHAYNPNDITKDFDIPWYVVQHNNDTSNQRIVLPGESPDSDGIKPMNFSYIGSSWIKQTSQQAYNNTFMLIIHYNSGYDEQGSLGKNFPDTIGTYSQFNSDLNQFSDQTNYDANDTQGVYPGAGNRHYDFQITLPKFMKENGNYINYVQDFSPLILTPPNDSFSMRTYYNNNNMFQNNDNSNIYSAHLPKPGIDLPFVGGNAYIVVSFTIHDQHSLPALNTTEANKLGLDPKQALDNNQQDSYLSGFVQNDTSLNMFHPVVAAQKMISPDNYYRDLEKVVRPKVEDRFNYASAADDGINAYNSCKPYNSNYGYDIEPHDITGNRIRSGYENSASAAQTAYSDGYYHLAASAAAKGGSEYAEPNKNNNYRNDINGNYSNAQIDIHNSDNLNLDSLNDSDYNRLNNGITSAYNHGISRGSNAYRTGYSEATANIKARNGYSYASSADAACAADQSNAALENAQSSAYVHGYSEGEFNPNEYAASGAKAYDNGNCIKGGSDLPKDISSKLSGAKLKRATNAYNSGYSEAAKYAANGANSYSDTASNVIPSLNSNNYSAYQDYVNSAFKSGQNIASIGYSNGANDNSVYNKNYSQAIANSADRHAQCAMAKNNDLINNIQKAYKDGYDSNNGELAITSVPNFNFGTFINNKNKTTNATMSIPFKNNKVSGAKDEKFDYFDNHKPPHTNDDDIKTNENPSLLQVIDYAHKSSHWDLTANISSVVNLYSNNPNQNIGNNQWSIDLVPNQGQSQNFPSGKLPNVSSNYSINYKDNNSLIFSNFFNFNNSNSVLNTSNDYHNSDNGDGRGINNVYYSNDNIKLRTPINVGKGKYNITINWTLNRTINSNDVNK